jgi:Bacterial regulatory proteins, tetR family
MKMMALRNQFMNDRPVLNLVSVDTNDLVEIFGEHARGHQTRVPLHSCHTVNLLNEIFLGDFLLPARDRMGKPSGLTLRPKGGRDAGQATPCLLMRKIKIVLSARRLFNRYGFDAVSIDDVMADAGLTRGSFYSYFENKGALYAEAVTHKLWHNPLPLAALCIVHGPQRQRRTA